MPRRAVSENERCVGLRSGARWGIIEGRVHGARTAFPRASHGRMKSDEAEQLRKRYLYRRLIVTGRLKLHRHAAVRLIGPDCAYHLYGHYAGDTPKDAPEADG